MRPGWRLAIAVLLLGTGFEVRAAPPATPAGERTLRDAVSAPVDASAQEGLEPCAPPKRRPRVRVVLDGKVNLNTADAQLLNMLPGVGMASAERIIARRERRPFRRPEELVRVKGFGARRYQRVRPYVSVEGPSTLRPVWTGLPRSEAEPPDPQAAAEPGA
ncbi:MAG TPA: helix-hairpin-helix domain-containing protein [Myxococcaceae bacterium]|nr:helix-hairpin-helix domain-containing protein [Myxococcaceae bacterium]